MNVPHLIKKSQNEIIKINSSKTERLRVPGKISKIDTELKRKRQLINKAILDRNTKLQIKKLVKTYKVVKENVQQKEIISRTLRRKFSEKLLKELVKGVSIDLTTNSNNLIIKLEDYTYRLTSNSYKEYSTKINDLIFIFENYKSFKTNLLNGTVNIYQLVLFEKDVKQEANKIIYKPSIKNRRLVLAGIKKLLLDNNTVLFRNSKILTDIIITSRSKVLELLLYDIPVDQEYLVNFKKLANLINARFYLHEIIIGKISSEQILLIMEQTNYQVDDKSISVDYSKFNLTEIEALIDQENVTGKKLMLDKNKIEAGNNNGNFIINWDPSR